MLGNFSYRRLWPQLLTPRVAWFCTLGLYTLLFDSSGWSLLVWILDFLLCFFGLFHLVTVSCIAKLLLCIHHGGGLEWTISMWLKRQENIPSFSPFGSWTTDLVSFAGDYNWPLNPNWFVLCFVTALAFQGMREMSAWKSISAKGWLKLQKRIPGTATSIVPTLLPCVSQSSPPLCQHAPLPRRESEPRLYAAFSSRTQIDPLNPPLFENLAPLRFTTCWGVYGPRLYAAQCASSHKEEDFS